MKATPKLKKLTTLFSVSVISAAAVMFAILALSGSKLYSVQSGSMSPAFEKGALVLARKKAENQIHIGDVVTYINPKNTNQTITHRVIATPTADNEYKFVTKGDANTLPDEPIAGEFIIGTTQFTIPKAGYALDFARSIAGLLLLIYIPAIFLVAAEVQKLKDYYRSNQPYYASEAIRKMLMERRQEVK